MCEPREVGRKEGVGLANVHIQLEPVPSWGDAGRAQAVLSEPGVDRSHTVRVWCSELSGLWEA